MTTLAQPDAPQREEMKSRIIGFSMNAFYNQGIRNVTMDDIAHQLSMSKRTLYQLFVDKEDLLLTCLQHYIKSEEVRISEIYVREPSVLGVLLYSFKEKMQHMDERRACFIEELTKYPRVLAYFEKRNREHEDDAVSFLNQGIKEGVFREGVNFRIVYRLLSLNMEKMPQTDMVRVFSQREVFTNTVIPYVRGCCTLKGIAQIDKFLEEVERELK